MVTNARPPQSPLLNVVAPPPPATPEDTIRTLVLEVSAGENGLRWLRPPSVLLSSRCLPSQPVSFLQCSEVLWHLGCCGSHRHIRCELWSAAACGVVFTATSTSAGRCDREREGRLTRHPSRSLEVRRARGAFARARGGGISRRMVCRAVCKSARQDSECRGAAPLG